MSFLGGAECSTAGNPLSQFTKHVQDDKSLQRDRLVGRSNGGMSEGFRGASRGEANPEPNQMSALPPQLAMEQMRREFESHHIAPQRNGSPSWAGEFDPGMGDRAMMEAAFQAPKSNGFDPAEFRSYSQRTNSLNTRSASPMEAATTSMGAYRQPMAMRYGGMLGGNTMGMGMYGGGYGGQSMVQQEPVQSSGKGKERMVELDERDWEAQFAELDSKAAEEGEVDEEAFAQDGGGIGQHRQKIKAETTALAGSSDMLNQSWRDHNADYANWGGFDGDGLNSHLRDPELGDYMFEDDNIFSQVKNPFEEGVRIMDAGGNLSLASLAFEAAVQKDPQHVEAWTRLGAAQAQNEKESPAIRALEQAIKLDPTNLDALMGLAVSYTNEGYDSTAYRTLERWLSTKYPSLAPNDGLGTDPHATELGFTERHILHQRVIDLFIAAAQLSPDPATMDPDVQVGLGVLFYGAEEYDKAVDCFSAALASSESGSTNSAASAMGSNQRPLLWNRLGATLANSGRSEEAIEAYERALELNPNFVRARYNLGVSCINIGCYAEAAQHLLGALAMHAVVEREGKQKARELMGDGAAAEAAADQQIENIMRQNQSTNLYDTLRRVFSQMNRKDLAEKVVSGLDVDIFRDEFDFIKP
ncbi:hypothetical protein MRB53_042038 [Persea americana]|nr:hypothetical protein MRB53_042038 [Persea americana]